VAWRRRRPSRATAAHQSSATGSAIPQAIFVAARRFATATTLAARTTAAKSRRPAVAAGAVPPARRASAEPAVRTQGSAMGNAVPQARCASTGPAVTQPRSAIMGGSAARRAKCAAATGASTRTRPTALLVFFNPCRVDREWQARARYDAQIERDLAVGNLPRA